MKNDYRMENILDLNQKKETWNENFFPFLAAWDKEHLWNLKYFTNNNTKAFHRNFLLFPQYFQWLRKSFFYFILFCVLCYCKAIKRPWM